MADLLVAPVSAGASDGGREALEFGNHETCKHQFNGTYCTYSEVRLTGYRVGRHPCVHRGGNTKPLGGIGLGDSRVSIGGETLSRYHRS